MFYDNELDTLTQFLINTFFSIRSVRCNLKIQLVRDSQPWNNKQIERRKRNSPRRIVTFLIKINYNLPIRFIQQLGWFSKSLGMLFVYWLLLFKINQVHKRKLQPISMILKVVFKLMADIINRANLAVRGNARYPNSYQIS
jgi:hypothetical protein